MKWLISLAFATCFGAAASIAQAPSCAKSEAACVLDAAWSAALILPDEKRARLAQPFLEIANLSGEANLVTFWEDRFDQATRAIAAYPDYGWEKAEPILTSKGIDALISIAERRAAPLSFGRADVLLAAGVKLRDENPPGSLKLNSALLGMIKTASAFEKPNLAHAAAELAMARCDTRRLADAIAFTDAPDNLRYAFWRKRVSGDALSLLSRVRAIDNDQDTRDVRRALDGYRAILEFGYCPEAESVIGG